MTQVDFEQIVKTVKAVNYQNDYPLNEFTIEDLTKLADLAKKEKFDIKIFAEYSNYYQGVLVGITKVNKQEHAQSDQE